MLHFCALLCTLEQNVCLYSLPRGHRTMPPLNTGNPLGADCNTVVSSPVCHLFVLFEWQKIHMNNLDRSLFIVPNKSLSIHLCCVGKFSFWKSSRQVEQMTIILFAISVTPAELLQ